MSMKSKLHDPLYIKFMIRRFSERDKTILGNMLKTKMITWAKIEEYAEDMRKPHVDALENIRQHLWLLANTGVSHDKPG